MANGNYWEKQRGDGYAGPLPNPNAPIDPAVLERAQIAKLVQDAFERENTPYSPAPGTWSMPMATPNNMLGVHKDPMGAPFITDPVLAKQSQQQPDNLIHHVYHADDGVSGLGDAANRVFGSNGLLGGILDSVRGVGRLVADEANNANANDPNVILDRLRQQYGSYAYDGPSAQQMVSREFDPQFAAIDNAAHSTEGRYAANAKNLAGLYQAYANDVLAGRQADQATYAQGTKDINSSYQAAQAETTKNMSGLTKEMSDQLALLGQQSAAPSVMQEKQKLLSDQLGQLSQAQGSAAALNTQLGANAYAYDTAQHGVAKQAGINAQGDLAAQLEDRMAGYDTQRLALEGNRGQALNNYGMMIQKIINEGNSGIGQQVNDAFKTIMQQQSDASDRELQQARLDLDLQKFASSQSGGSSMDTSKLNPYDALVQRAQSSYGDPQQASNASDVLYQTGMLEPNAPNMKVLMDLLEQNNPGWTKDPNNRALAYDYFTRILNANKR